MVLSDLTFSADKVSLFDWQVNLYEDSVYLHDGTKLSAGYVSKLYTMIDDEYTAELEALLLWESLQATQDYKAEYNEDAINALIFGTEA